MHTNLMLEPFIVSIIHVHNKTILFQQKHNYLIFIILSDSPSKNKQTGSFNSLYVLISTRGDLIFKIGLPNTITVPVQLNILYRDNRNRKRMFRRITGQAYNNTELITHLEPSSLVPDFRTFQVEIALHYRGQEGPFNRTGLVYGTFINSVRFNYVLFGICIH